MEEHADTEHPDMYGAHDQVVDEVSDAKGLDQATGTSISENALCGGHGPALLIDVHNPQRGGIDDDALNERDDMDIPVQLGAAAQLGIGLRKEDRRQPRRDERVDDLVKDKGENDFMGMV